MKNKKLEEISQIISTLDAKIKEVCAPEMPQVPSHGDIYKNKYGEIAMIGMYDKWYYLTFSDGETWGEVAKGAPFALEGATYLCNIQDLLKLYIDKK